MIDSRIRSFLCAPLAVGLLTSCATNSMVASEGDIVPAHTISTLTPAELNERKRELDGATVRVRAYLVFESEARALWSNAADEANGKASRCTSLLYPSTLEQEVRKFNRQNVVVTGTFQRDVTRPNSVYLGLCNYTGVKVQSIEAAVTGG